MVLNKLVRNNSLFNYRNFKQCVSKQLQQKTVIENGVFLDTRKSGEREIINPAWIPRNGKGSLRIEKIDKKDFELIGSFYNCNGNIHNLEEFNKTRLHSSDVQHVFWQK